MSTALDKLFEGDHRRVRQLLLDLQDLPETAVSDRAAGVRELTRQLVPHCRAEEWVLYANLNLDNSTGHHLPVKALQDDHEVLEALLAEIVQASSNWGPRLARFVEILEVHFDEEERLAFPVVRQLADEGVIPPKPAALVLEIKRRALARLS